MQELQLSLLKIMDLLDSLDSEVEHFKEIKSGLFGKLSKKDLEISDLIHMNEKVDFSASESIAFAKSLHDASVSRRRIKESIKLSKLTKSRIDQLHSHVKEVKENLQKGYEDWTNYSGKRNYYIKTENGKMFVNKIKNIENRSSGNIVGLTTINHSNQSVSVKPVPTKSVVSAPKTTVKTHSKAIVKTNQETHSKKDTPTVKKCLIKRYYKSQTKKWSLYVDGRLVKHGTMRDMLQIIQRNHYKTTFKTTDERRKFLDGKRSFQGSH